MPEKQIASNGALFSAEGEIVAAEAGRFTGELAAFTRPTKLWSALDMQMTSLSDPALPDRALGVGIHTVLPKTDWESLREILAKR